MIFSSLTYLSSCADAAVALGRIGSFLTAEELAEPYAIDKDSKHAIDVEGDFQWEAVPKAGASGGKFQNGKDGAGARKAKQQEKKEDPLSPLASLAPVTDAGPDVAPESPESRSRSDSRASTNPSEDFSAPSSRHEGSETGLETEEDEGMVLVGRPAP